MKYDSSYLVCREHIGKVRDFLGQFFEEEKGKYNFDEWVTFHVPRTDFQVNLMTGKDQPLTQNMTFEIPCDSLEELQMFAEKHGRTVEDFIATGAPQKYRYYYVEIPGPKGICKIEANYCEDVV